MDFVLLNGGGWRQIAPDDEIEVLVAYRKGNYPVAFIEVCRVNGQTVQHCMPRIYMKNLMRLENFTGQVAAVRTDGEDLLIKVIPSQ